MSELKIYYKQLPNNIKGLYDNNKKNEPIIIINTNQTEIEKRYTLTEELIHFQYYPDCNFYKCKTMMQLSICSWIENKVKNLMVNILISDEILLTKVIPYLKSYSIYELAEEIGVTESLLSLKLEKYNFINKENNG